MTDADLRAYAHRRLKARNDFKTLIIVWLAVSVLVTVLWMVNGGGDFWPVWPMLGIGIGVLVSGIHAYGPRLGFISERDIEAEVQRMKHG